MREAPLLWVCLGSPNVPLTAGNLHMSLLSSSSSHSNDLYWHGQMISCWSAADTDEDHGTQVILKLKPSSYYYHALCTFNYYYWHIWMSYS